MCGDHSKIQLCLHPDPSILRVRSRHDVNTFWNDESYLQWLFPHDTVALRQMESIKAVLLCSSFFTGVEINTIYLSQLKVKMSMYRNNTCSIYTVSHAQVRGSQEGACAAAFFFCFLLSCFFFTSPLFCFWRFSWIFSLNFFFWLLIFSSSAFLLASKSGSWHCRLTPHSLETPKLRACAKDLKMFSKRNEQTFPSKISCFLLLISFFSSKSVDSSLYKVETVLKTSQYNRVSRSVMYERPC